MIAYIRGQVIEKDNQSLVVDVSGIGYEIYVTTPDLEHATIGSEQHFYTFHAVKETSEELFGFPSLSAKRLFEMLISVQGVGPKAALAILSLADNETVRNAIANSDSKFIAGASGVGKKTAERIAVDLQDKVGTPTSYGAVETGNTVAITNNDALDALVALGYSLNEATSLLVDVPRDLPANEQVSMALRQR